MNIFIKMLAAMGFGRRSKNPKQISQGQIEKEHARAKAKLGVLLETDKTNPHQVPIKNARDAILNKLSENSNDFINRTIE